jgi:phenylacetate-CoA ligase
LEDIRKLPFTTKEDLRLRYPLNGVLAVPKENVLRVHMTSGTTGKPTLSPFTANDLQLAYRMFARLLAATGATKGDVFLCMYGYGLFLGGLIVGPAAELVGIEHIPSGSGVASSRQLEFMQDLRPTIIGATPSFHLHISEVAKEKGIDVRQLGVKVQILGAEAYAQKTRDKLRETWGTDIYDVGGTCELFHIYYECAEHTGLHMTEDTVIFEILDPKTDEPVGPGEKGELVVTTLMKDAMPLLRWRTRDITSFTEGPCPCGRTFRRIDHFSGRVDDMIKVKGTAVFPSQIEEIIRSIPELKDSEFQIVVSQTKTMANILTVRTEIPESLSAVSGMIGKKIEEEVKNKILVSAKVELVKLGTLPRFTHKAKRVVGPEETK